MDSKYDQQSHGLYRSEYEHDACGVGMVANLSGEASHDIVAKGMTILKRLMHRGATGNDPETGDGAGLLMRIPHGFFKKILGNGERGTYPPSEASAEGGSMRGGNGNFGVAMIFGGEGEEKKIENVIKSEGCEVLGWRDVPTNPDAIGHDARSVMPRIRQVFIAAENAKGAKGSGGNGLCDLCVLCGKENPAFERQLYVIRRQIEKATKDTYVCSCSSRTIVYKGLLLATQIEKFYPDLSDPDFISPFAIVHQR